MVNTENLLIKPRLSVFIKNICLHPVIIVIYIFFVIITADACNYQINVVLDILFYCIYCSTKIFAWLAHMVW